MAKKGTPDPMPKGQPIIDHNVITKSGLPCKGKPKR